MNQILSVKEINNKHPKKTKTKNKYQFSGGGLTDDVKSIISFFAITLIIFGVFNIGSASYALATKNSKSKAKVATKPVITAQTTEAGDEVVITVQSENVINEVTYYWDDEEETKINGAGRNVVEETIPLPAGENNLYVRAVDVNGQSDIIEQQFTKETSIKIDIQEDENFKIKITVEGTENNEIKHIKYRWNNEKMEQIDIEDVKGEELIDARSGKNTLTVEATDIHEETVTETRTIQGENSETSSSGGGVAPGDNSSTSKPKVNVEKDESTGQFIIVASDEAGLEKIEVKVNGEDGGEADVSGNKEVRVPYDREFSHGDEIEITVYNKNGQKETIKGQYEE